MFYNKILIFLIFIFLINSICIFPSEKSSVFFNFSKADSSDGKINFSFDSRDPRNKIHKYRETIRESSPELIKTGKSITIAGLTGFGVGVGTFSLGILFGCLGLYASGFFYHLYVYDNNWGNAWHSWYSNINSIGIGAYSLFTLAFISWIAGIILIPMIFLIIPGIILWYNGEKGFRRKRDNNNEVSVKPAFDAIGISISFNTVNKRAIN